ncbi:hypothetical protein SAMN05421737_103129 [Shouchella lonarensis]|uniref:Uncharacterized protein n=1 Tax=Shouchella lonarensis TaxID=1464122 RepID=A0A1G6HB93_9BACI|nr:hypothetical protein SAMN05421737_103129 [Shouchella lonarensis]
MVTRATKNLGDRTVRRNDEGLLLDLKRMILTSLKAKHTGRNLMTSVFFRT